MSQLPDTMIPRNNECTKIPECSQGCILHANTECPICLEECHNIIVDGRNILKNIVVLDCFHAMCSTCFVKYIYASNASNASNACPICRNVICKKENSPGGFMRMQHREHTSSYYSRGFERRQTHNRMLRDAPPLHTPRSPRIITIPHFPTDDPEYLHGEEYIDGTFQSANHQVYVAMFIAFDLIIVFGWCFMLY